MMFAPLLQPSFPFLLQLLQKLRRHLLGVMVVALAICAGCSSKTTHTTRPGVEVATVRIHYNNAHAIVVGGRALLVDAGTEADAAELDAKLRSAGVDPSTLVAIVRSGATYALMTPDTFLARLCALVPPPGAHTVRYYGVLAGHHALRSRIIPRPEEPQPLPKQLALFIPHGPLELPAITSLLESQLRSAAPHRLSWMTLLARVFRIDISVCARCSGPMRVTGAVTTPEQIAAELRGARPPPRPSSPPGQLLLFSFA